MTDKQKLAEDNHNLIYFLMHRYNLNEDHYGPLAEGLVRAANSFDAGRGIKFSTYAIHCMERCLWVDNRMPGKAIPQDKVVHIDAPNPDAPGTTYGDMLYDPRSVEDDVTTKCWYDSFYSSLRGLHRRVFDLRLQGLSQQEIADVLSLTQPQVSKILNKLKSSLKKERR